MGEKIEEISLRDERISELWRNGRFVKASYVQGKEGVCVIGKVYGFNERLILFGKVFEYNPNGKGEVFYPVNARSEEPFEMAVIPLWAIIKTPYETKTKKTWDTHKLVA